MWCAGEIYSAIRYNVNTVPVKCTGDFKFPTDDFLTNELQMSGQTINYRNWQDLALSSTAFELPTR